MKKTLLIGSFGAKNLGDELILQAALKKYSPAFVMTANRNFSLNFGETNFKTIPPFPTGFRSFFQFLVSPARWKQYFSLRKQIKKVVFPGGGLFKNNLKAVIIWSVNIFWIKVFLPKTNIFFEAQGIDFSNNKFIQKLVLWSFNQAKKVSVRDKISKKNLQKIGYKKNILVVPDAAASYLKKIDIPKTPKNHLKKIFIQASKNFDEELLRNKISKKFPNHKIQFIAFDELDIKKIQHNTSLSKEKILFPTDEFDLINECSKTDIFIGQRFHFLVLGHLFGGKEKTFLLEKPYAPKTKILAGELNLEIF